jgi:predicted AAA+ superfamily ATPase
MTLGTYPAVVSAGNLLEKKEVLTNLATNYLYKDIYTFESIRNPRVFESLLKMLALQIGSFVSINELSNELGISRATVEKYIRLLEQSYIIKIIRSFSNNPRKEIKKAFKIYFMDIGVRNAIIDETSSVENRKDKGEIFENFFVIERIKNNATKPFPPRFMFWRDRFGSEIDLVEYLNNEINAFECKWNKNSPVSFNSFKKLYPEATTKIVSPEFLLE